ncbi:MAG: ATP-binding protein, partial [Acidimicrobiales bacterium]
PLEITVIGDLGHVAADVATPLAVILAEVLQNAVEHAFDSASQAIHDEAPRRWNDDVRAGHVWVILEDRDTELALSVRDDGRGLPAKFDIEETHSLGLSIVRDLVMTQLGGTITLETVPESTGGGTLVTVVVPSGAQ